MHKGLYRGGLSGNVKGTYRGLNSGQKKGLSSNEKKTRFSDHDVIWSMGDSINRGNSTAVGTTPIYGTVKQWNDSARNLRIITNTDLLEPVAAGAIGSQWPAFGIRYHFETRRIPVFVNCGVGGSAFYNPTAGFSWYTNDTLFTNAVQKVKNCLAFMGKTAPDHVIIGSGYNDSVQGNSVTLAHITSLVDRILAQFPGVKIWFTLPFSGSATINTYANLTILYQIRKWIKSLIFTYPTVGICGDHSVLWSWTNCFQADLVHLNVDGNNFLGDKSARGLTFGASYHKYTKSLASLMYWRISGARLIMIDKFVRDLESAGYLDQIDSLLIPANAGDDTDGVGWKNCIQDWGFIANHIPADQLNFSDYTTTGYYPDGLADAERISSSPMTLTVDKANLSNDFTVGIFLDTNAVGAGTAAAPHGIRESAAGGIVLIRQNAAGAIGCFAASTAETLDTVNVETTFAGSSDYWVARSSGTQLLIKNGSTVGSGSVAAAALAPGANIRGASLGNYNNNGTIQLRWAGGVKAKIVARYTTVNVSTLRGIINEFLALWLTSIK